MEYCLASNAANLTITDIQSESSTVISVMQIYSWEKSGTLN